MSTDASSHPVDPILRALDAYAAMDAFRDRQTFQLAASRLRTLLTLATSHEEEIQRLRQERDAILEALSRHRGHSVECHLVTFDLGFARGRTMVSSWPTCSCRHAKAEQRITALESALSTYGQHLPNCPMRDRVNWEALSGDTATCTCGYTATLTSRQGEGSSETGE